jgi:hypothetical protein
VRCFAGSNWQWQLRFVHSSSLNRKIADNLDTDLEINKYRNGHSGELKKRQFLAGGISTQSEIA